MDAAHTQPKRCHSWACPTSQYLGLAPHFSPPHLGTFLSPAKRHQAHCDSIPIATMGPPTPSPLSRCCPSPGHHPGGLRRPLRRQAHQGAAGGRAAGGERRLHGALRRAADDHRWVPHRGGGAAGLAPVRTGAVRRGPTRRGRLWEQESRSSVSCCCTGRDKARVRRWPALAGR